MPGEDPTDLEKRYLLKREIEINRKLEAIKAADSLYLFAMVAFEILEPGKTFEPNWHIKLICEYLELVSDGAIRFLVINIPPRHMKSLLVSVIWPVWIWNKRKEKRMIFSSYAMELSIFQSQKRRRLIESSWVATNFKGLSVPHGSEDRKALTENESLGFFKSTSTGAMVGGQGSDIIVSDDPSNPEKAESKADREAANAHVEYLVGTRLDNPKTGAVVLCQQRTHHDDSTARIISKWKEAGEDFVVVSIPAEAEKNETIIFPKSGETFERKEGDLLWPSRFGPVEIAKMKIVLGPYGTSAQLQQRPTPKGGGLLKREWWRRFSEPPAHLKLGWFLDTATKDGQENDWTVALLMGKGEDGLYVLDVVRKKIQAALLEEFVSDIWAMRKASVLSIEDKDSGQRVIQYFKMKKCYPVRAYKPEGDKSYRLSLCAPMLFAGKVFIPESAPWVHKFLEEVEQFPRGENDDQVDALSQAVIYWTFSNKVGSLAGVPEQQTNGGFAGSLNSRDNF